MKWGAVKQFNDGIFPKHLLAGCKDSRGVAANTWPSCPHCNVGLLPPRGHPWEGNMTSSLSISQVSSCSQEAHEYWAENLQILSSSFSCNPIYLNYHKTMSQNSTDSAFWGTLPLLDLDGIDFKWLIISLWLFLHSQDEMYLYEKPTGNYNRLLQKCWVYCVHFACVGMMQNSSSFFYNSGNSFKKIIKNGQILMKILLLSYWCNNAPTHRLSTYPLNNASIHAVMC